MGSWQNPIKKARRNRKRALLTVGVCSACVCSQGADGGRAAVVGRVDRRAARARYDRGRAGKRCPRPASRTVKLVSGRHVCWPIDFYFVARGAAAARATARRREEAAARPGSGRAAAGSRLRGASVEAGAYRERSERCA
eukprot:5178383-Prymnesium_polylepis.1